MKEKITQINTYSYLYNCAKLSLDKALTGDENHLIIYYTFLALTIEAFVNHIGMETYHWWKKCERDLSTKSKIIILLR